jgi:NAD(P) transhydrogenase subunit beta
VSATTHTDYILSTTFPALPTHDGGTPAWAMLAYLIAGVCFILALRGLSSPSTSQRGNRLGMIGMAIAVVTTLLIHSPQLGQGLREAPSNLDWGILGQILAAIAIGAVIGLVTARRIAMTAMPQLVAAFHSLVGLAAVLVGAAAFLNPEAFGIATRITPIAEPSFLLINPSAVDSASASRCRRTPSRLGHRLPEAQRQHGRRADPAARPPLINLGTCRHPRLRRTSPGPVALDVLDRPGALLRDRFLLIIPFGGADMPGRRCQC